MTLVKTAPILNSPEFASAMARARTRDKLGKSVLSSWMVAAYRFRLLRPLIRALIARLEGGAMHSHSLRRILREQYEVELGMYSYGPVIAPGILAPGTRIGRYCSFGPEVEVIRRNHPTRRMSVHPLFYDHRAGVFEKDQIMDVKENPLVIGHDVWIGFRAIILPNCRTIGNGANIGAGAVVTKDVPPFAIVGGNPARVIGFRFEPDMCEAVEETSWWMHSLTELSPYLAPLSAEPSYERLAALRSLSKQ